MTRTENNTTYEVVIYYRTAKTGAGRPHMWTVRDNLCSRALAEDLAKATLPVFTAHFHEEYDWFGSLTEVKAEVIEHTTGLRSVGIFDADLTMPQPVAVNGPA